MIRAGDSRLAVGMPNADPEVSRGSLFWKSALDGFNEIGADQASHYDAATDTYIDFIFAASPPTLLLQLEFHAPVSDNPRDLYFKHVSDHAPICISFRTPAP